LLMNRMLQPQRGHVILAGMDAATLTIESIRRAVAVVLQEPFLIAGSVVDNIRLGKPQATDEEVRAAARLAEAEEFVDALEEGFASIIGESGATLSGGQQQRLAIARGLLMD